MASQRTGTIFRFNVAYSHIVAVPVTGLLLGVISLQAQLAPPLLQTLDARGPIPAFISPESAANRPGDRLLAEWALQAWQKASGGTLKFKAVEEKKSLLRLIWISGESSLYG